MQETRTLVRLKTSPPSTTSLPTTLAVGTPNRTLAATSQSLPDSQMTDQWYLPMRTCIRATSSSRHGESTPAWLLSSTGTNPAGIQLTGSGLKPSGHAMLLNLVRGTRPGWPKFCRQQTTTTSMLGNTSTHACSCWICRIDRVEMQISEVVIWKEPSRTLGESNVLSGEASPLNMCASWRCYGVGRPAIIVVEIQSNSDSPTGRRAPSGGNDEALGQKAGREVQR